MNKIVWFKDCSYENKNLVGGKCSSLGELYHLSKQIGFSVANGFAISTIVYDNFLKFNNIGSIINNKINDIDIDDIRKLETVSKYIKELIETIENEHNDIFYNIFLKFITDLTGSGASEYEIYFNYMLKNHSDKIIIRELNWCNSDILDLNSKHDYISYHWYVRK